MSRKLPDSWDGDDKLRPFGPFIGFKWKTLFDTLEREAYRRCGIKKMTLPSRLLFPDRPAVDMDMVDFREAVIRRSTPGPIKDVAWRHIAELVRTRNEHWLLWALFTAKPGLGSVGYDLTKEQPRAAKRILHAALIVEFGAALLRLPLERAFVYNRMVDAAATHATGRKRKKRETSPGESYDSIVGGSREPHSRIGIPHEDTEHQILEWLVEQINELDHGRITERQEALIRRTYLDLEPLKDVATDLGVSLPSASKMRKRGTDRLALYLNRRDLIEPDNGGDAAPAAGNNDRTETGQQTTTGKTDDGSGLDEPQATTIDDDAEGYDEGSAEAGEDDDAGTENPR